MQTQVIQQAKTYYPQPIQKVVENMQVMSAQRQQQVLDYIELLCFYDGIGLVDEEKSEQEKPKKRHAGTAKGKATFSDDFDKPLEDFEMTEEELITQDNKTNDFTAYLADWRERNKDILTDDDPWTDVRDKNDFGREPVCWED